MTCSNIFAHKRSKPKYYSLVTSLPERIVSEVTIYSVVNFKVLMVVFYVDRVAQKMGTS